MTGMSATPERTLSNATAADRLSRRPLHRSFLAAISAGSQTGRMVRFITNQHAQAVSNASGHVHNPKAAVVPKDHRTEVTPVATVE
jgi:hypothetical protein